jgi:hypothetical protein
MEPTDKAQRLPFKTYQQHVVAAVTVFKREQRQRAAAGTLKRAFVYCREAKPNEEGELRLFIDGEPPDPRWTRVTNESLRCSVPYADFYSWVYEPQPLRRSWAGNSRTFHQPPPV